MKNLFFNLLCTCLLVSASSFFLQDLSSINKEIQYLQTIDQILSTRRQLMYNYSKIEQGHAEVLNIQNFNKSLEFKEGLQLTCSHQSGQRSTLFFLKYKLYLAEMFKNNTKIYQSTGNLVHSINSTLIFMTIIKATIDYQLCYLSDTLQASCGVYTGNISEINYKTVQLNVTLQNQISWGNIKHYHVQKYQGNNIHSLLMDDGNIYVYDGSGKERGTVKSTSDRVVKYLDHNPYPMIVGTDSVSFLQTYKPGELSLGCPVTSQYIITAEVETPFSNIFYLLTDSQIIVMQYSLKKADKVCKVSHRIPISSPSSSIKMLYPTLILNNTYVNITDTLTPPQITLPIPLCHNNFYETQYRNNQHYLLHRCCNSQSNCTSNLYLRSRKSSSSSKHYKYIIFLIIVFGILLKQFWGKIFGEGTKKNQMDSGNQFFEGFSSDPLVEYQKKMIREKRNNIKNNK